MGHMGQMNHMGHQKIILKKPPCSTDLFRIQDNFIVSVLVIDPHDSFDIYDFGDGFDLVNRPDSYRVTEGTRVRLGRKRR